MKVAEFEKDCKGGKEHTLEDDWVFTKNFLLYNLTNHTH